MDRGIRSLRRHPRIFAQRKYQGSVRVTFMVLQEIPDQVGDDSLIHYCHSQELATKNRDPSAPPDQVRDHSG